jgi:hypothetical protein
MMAPFKHVTDVEVLARYFVELTFDGEERRVVDLEPLLEGPAFEHLKQDYELFCAVRADEDAATIVWPNGADMSPRTLYSHSRPSVPATARA